ncbi:MAG: murein L,D-transpeptidase catalytic domain family protein [Fusobacterium necrophorum]|nr:murein L,D-transpeptidase catalytic domain family protein [Fusobacterium necrophorum]
MKKIVIFFFLIFSISFGKVYKEKDIQEMYENMGLKGELSYQAFSQGFRGMAHIKARKTNLLTIIDFTKPSTSRRLFIFDMSRKKLILSSHVSHGKGSGGLYATSFSNVEGSYKSSDGFFLTGNAYMGKNGYSLRLHGLEKGRNDNAYARTLVIHSSQYSSQEFGRIHGRLGRSLGCYTVPEYLNHRIINMLKNNQVFYVHSQGLHYANYKKLLTQEQK